MSFLKLGLPYPENPKLRKSFVIFFLIFIYSSSFCQDNPGVINAFKYALVQSGPNDQGNIIEMNNYLRNEISKKGIILLNNDSRTWPREAQLNICLVSYWIASYRAGGFALTAKSTLTIKNCKNEIVYSNEASASHYGYQFDDNVQMAFRRSYKPIEKFDYFFSPTLTPTIEYPKVENTGETENSLKSYFDKNQLDPLEGIYQSYQSQNLSFYKIAIVKSNSQFKIIIIESELPAWLPGEVKGYLDPSSMNDLYSAKWYMANKTPIQTFASFKNGGIFEVELKNNNGEKDISQFVKMYPKSNVTKVSNGIEVKATGTGFVISKIGIVATNAHVVENANHIDLIVKNEFGTSTYKTVLLLKDAKNDVALLQISDTTFKGFSQIPYSLIEKAEIGEKVFTIGYPLNDFMGNNYKVNDGLISASSGVADDPRYFQISVPLQPGNSGGPLFNKDGNVIGITSARLNSEAVGMQVENVNYAIKINYLLDLYNMLPNNTILSNTSTLSGKELQDQVKTLKNYVCLIRIY